jgi:hypothetical protein
MVFSVCSNGGILRIHERSRPDVQPAGAARFPTDWAVGRAGIARVTMPRRGTLRPLAVTFAVALLSCVYTGVASADESLLLAGGEAEAVAEMSESAVAEASEPAHAVRKGKKSAEAVAETSEPVSTAPETSVEPAGETSEPVSTAPGTSVEPAGETSEPVSTAAETSPEPAAQASEPAGPASEPPPEPVAETSEPVSDAGVVAPADPLSDIPGALIPDALLPNALIPDALLLMNIPGLSIGSSLPPNTINALRDVFSDLAAVASGDPRAPLRTDRGARDGPPVNDDPSPLPEPGPQAPVPVAPAGASGAPGGGSSGGFIALTAFLLIASLSLSRVVELSLTHLGSPKLVADLARPD